MDKGGANTGHNGIDGILPPQPPGNMMVDDMDIAELRVQLQHAQQSNTVWRQRFSDLKFGSLAIDTLVRELLDENHGLMDRIEELHRQSETWRQTAERGALSGYSSVEAALQPAAFDVETTAKLQEDNARLSVENDYLKQALGERGIEELGSVDLASLPGDAALRFVLLASEVEELSQQLGEQYDALTRNNEEHERELQELRAHNEQWAEEVSRLRGQLSKAAAAAESDDRALPVQLQGELKRMEEEKQQLHEKQRELQERVRQLTAEKEGLLEQAAKSSASGQAANQADSQEAQEQQAMLKEFTDESNAMMDELRVMGDRIQQLLKINQSIVAENHLLNHRLIQAALGVVDDGELDGSFSTPGRQSTVVTEADYDPEEAQKQYEQIQREVAREEAIRKEAYAKRLKLQAKGRKIVEAHEHRRTERNAVPKTAEEIAADQAAAKEREAKRKEEREIARQALQKRIEEKAKEREEAIKRKQEEAVQKMREGERSRAQENAMLMTLKKDAQKRVNVSYSKYAGREDVGGFMRSLGYTAFSIQMSDDPSDDELRDAFKRAIVMTHPDRYVNKSLSDKALAEATYTRLQAWMKDCDLQTTAS